MTLQKTSTHDAVTELRTNVLEASPLNLRPLKWDQHTGQPQASLSEIANSPGRAAAYFLGLLGTDGGEWTPASSNAVDVGYRVDVNIVRQIDKRKDMVEDQLDFATTADNVARTLKNTKRVDADVVGGVSVVPNDEGVAWVATVPVLLRFILDLNLGA